MKRTLEINYGRGIKINKGNYQQDSPMWHEKLTIELNGQTDAEVVELEKKEYDIIRARVDKRVEDEWNKTALEQAGLRIRTKDGKKFPSVTSILKPEPYTGNPEYGTRGSEIHRLCNQFIEKGVWTEPEAKLETLSYADMKHKDFFAKFKDRLDFKGVKLNIEIFNLRLLYSGEIDLVCKVDKRLAVCDIKTGGWDWPQLVAYEKSNPKKAELLAIFDVKTNELHIIEVGSKEYEEAWEHFLMKRGEFKARFGV